jgi:cytidylate kinase
MDNKFIITINREFGSGGRSIGYKIAELLGVKVYDKAILEKLTEQYNLDEEEIEKLRAKKSHWWDDFCNFYRQFDSLGRSASEESKKVTSLSLYHTEARIIRGLAKEESCVIIGRSAFHIFKDDPSAFKIMIIADDEHRIQRLMKRDGISRIEAIKLMAEADNAREAYTKTFSGTSRYDARHYDLVCNVSGYDTDDIASFLANLIRRKFQLK